MAEILDCDKVVLDLDQLLIIEHKRFHCKLLSVLLLDASMYHPIRAFSYLLQNLILLVEDVGVLKGGRDVLGAGQQIFA